jgi:hypothetical protein
LERHAASVTRWATGVQLNGREFSKAELGDGDRLTIGSWEIQFDLEGFAATTEQGSAVRQSIEGFEGPPTAIRAVSSRQISVPAVVPAESAAIRDHSSSQVFADQLVLQLWTANYRARRRAKALINGIRAARFHADAMAADLAAMETELDLARAAYDLHIVNDDRLQQALTDGRREDGDREAPLVHQIATLQAELEHANASIARHTSEYEQLAAELAAIQRAANTPTVDPAVAKRAAELEAKLASQSHQLATLTRELELAREEHQRTAELYRLAAERTAELEETISHIEARKSLAPHASEAAQVAETSNETGNNVWQSIQPLEVESVSGQDPVTWDAVDAEEEVLPIPPASDEGESIKPATEWKTPVAEPSTLCQRPSDEEPRCSATVVAKPPTFPPLSGQPAAEYTSTSFIDKYRHLLEDDSEPTISVSLRGGRPQIDDEFLSPAKVETCASPADESDEALEAYMANMMRRVRSNSPSYASSQVASVVTESIQDAVADTNLPTNHSADRTQSVQSPDFLSDEPLRFEDLKLATRKQPLASDLAALREIANSTARTAIATHTQRQTRESALTKIVVAVTAMLSAAYLMASAPALDNWQFWVGVATCAVGITASVQVIVLERRRASSRPPQFKRT